MPHNPKLHADPDLLPLVSRCLTRDDAAWQALHDRFDPALRRWIRGRLGPRPVSGDAESLIAQNVWRHLILDDYRGLRAYDPARGAFTTFLYACMKVQLRLWREEQCRLAAPLEREKLIAERGGDLPEAVELADFLSWLRPVERDFVRVHQLGEPPPPDQPPLSPGHVRVCRHRVKQKLEIYESALDRMTTITYNCDVQTTFTYNGAGSAAVVQDLLNLNACVTMTYDQKDNVIYDLAGNPVPLKPPANGPGGPSETFKRQDRDVPPLPT
jgi:hypothetical protein